MSLFAVHVAEGDRQQVGVHVGQFGDVTRDFAGTVTFDLLVQLGEQIMCRSDRVHSERRECWAAAEVCSCGLDVAKQIVYVRAHISGHV